MTRLVLFADVQGNAIALEAIFAHAGRFQPDATLCLGDIASGAQPRETIHLLRKYNVLCVRGNMDEVLLTPELSAPIDNDSDENRKFHEIDLWGAAQLSADDQAFLRDLPLTLRYALDEKQSILCFHGAPQDINAPLDSRTSEEDLTHWLADYSGSIMATGHMHLPMLRTFGDTTIINPGSAGLPYGGKRLMPPQAQYALIEVEAGTVSIHFYTVAYNGDTLKNVIFSSGMPHADWYAGLWVI